MGCIKDNKGKKKELDGRKGVSKESTTHASTIGDYTWIEEEYGPSWCQEKVRTLWTNVMGLYLDEDKEQDEGFCGRIWGMEPIPIIEKRYPIYRSWK